ncbi:MAG TPA: nucleotidyltransferase family protein [Caulobacterales bacterium]|jgi:predicted nucleotidyltransferase|nr:nucleotidyltransferase family protein [Caulobacterales bacterium]
MTRAEALAKLRTLKPWLKDSYGVKRLGLFGSHARDEARADSDVDLLVEFEPDRVPGLAFFGMSAEISERLGAPVDLGTFSSLKPHYARHVLQDLLDV